MSALEDAALRQLFLDARTHMAWLDRPVSDETLHQLYDLARLGPTAANCMPFRVVFVKSGAAKEKLKPALRACEDFPGVVGPLIRSVAKAARERAVGCRG